MVEQVVSDIVEDDESSSVEPSSAANCSAHRMNMNVMTSVFTRKSRRIFFLDGATTGRNDEKKTNIFFFIFGLLLYVLCAYIYYNILKYLIQHISF